MARKERRVLEDGTSLGLDVIKVLSNSGNVVRSQAGHNECKNCFWLRGTVHEGTNSFYDYSGPGEPGAHYRYVTYYCGLSPIQIDSFGKCICQIVAKSQILVLIDGYSETMKLLEREKASFEKDLKKISGREAKAVIEKEILRVNSLIEVVSQKIGALENMKQ